MAARNTVYSVVLASQHDAPWFKETAGPGLKEEVTEAWPQSDKPRWNRTALWCGRKEVTRWGHKGRESRHFVGEGRKKINKTYFVFLNPSGCADRALLCESKPSLQ